MENITDLNDNERMVSISKTELAELPIATFKGKIVVIDKPEDVDAAVAELNKKSEIGFDTETKPSFKRGQSNLVSLLQLSTHDTCYLFRLNHIRSARKSEGSDGKSRYPEDRSLHSR